MTGILRQAGRLDRRRLQALPEAGIQCKLLQFLGQDLALYVLRLSEQQGNRGQLRHGEVHGPRQGGPQGRRMGKNRSQRHIRQLRLQPD